MWTFNIDFRNVCNTPAYFILSISLKQFQVCHNLFLMQDKIFFWRSGPTRSKVSSTSNFLDHTQWRTILDMTPLHEWSARRREFYLKTHNNFNRETSMPTAVFEPTILSGHRQQNYSHTARTVGPAYQIIPHPNFMLSYYCIFSHYGPSNILLNVCHLLSQHNHC
jgi:hypothetical protein